MTTIDPTEDARRALIPEMPAELKARIDKGEQVWTTDQMRAEFTVEGFAAPYVVVTRKSDGEPGVLQFTHSPRYYFGFRSENS